MVPGYTSAMAQTTDDPDHGALAIMMGGRRVLRLALAMAALAGWCSAGSCSAGSRSPEETGWWSEECATPTCTLHPCATQAGGADDGVACCIAAEGRGLDEQSAATLARDCNPETMSCDPDDYLSQAAAICVAQGAGLAAGGGFCVGLFQVNGDEGRAWWVVMNQHVDDCASGDCLEVDAVTGGPDTGSTCAWAD